MSRKITVWFGRTIFTAIICLASTSVSDCFAQNGRILHQPAQRVGRFLGMGYGVGYHHCNPGHDASYYNPYSAHNSYLVSQSPEYLAQYGHQRTNYAAGYHGFQNGYGQMNAGQYGASFGTPHSNYSGVSNPSGYPSSQGESVNATFEPVRKEVREEEEDDDSENDFQPRGYDETDDQPSSSDEDEGGFDDLEKELDSDGGEESEEAFFSEPSIFMKSSYGK